MNIYIFTVIVIFFTSMIDVFLFRPIKWGKRESGWDGFHITKWLFIAFLIANELRWQFPDYKEAGLMFMFLTIIVVGLHHFILHILFKEKR